jgi:uncharacterized YigZ family protein
MEAYLTIKQKAVGKLMINKSEFIGIAHPIRDEPDVAAHLMSARQQFTGASHYVYAYTVGRSQAIQKFTDDGEPSGTAGMPILELIKHRQIEDALLIVIRYYGGIKLGTGGLKRAYSHTAQHALELAGISRQVLCWTLRISFAYQHWGKIQREFENLHLEPDHIAYEEEITVQMAVPVDRLDQTIDRLKELTASNIKINQCQQEFRESNND